MTSYVYLHGFASSPASSKAQYFRKRFEHFGVELEIPELDAGDFEHLTLSGQLRVIERAVNGRAAVLLGSSMGGYLAALFAERHPEVERLVLLAPAFDLHHRWAARAGERIMAQWKATRSLPVFHYGQGCERNLHYELYEDAAKFPAFPNCTQPALVLQGLRDDIVPPELAREFCSRTPNAQLHLFDSGHELTNVLPEMWSLIKSFLSI
jgi:pimeloyl-ACP methyl ester carboxylesterase